MKIIRFILFFGLIVIIESLWAFPYRPDLFLLLIITFSVHHSTESGVMLSFFAGFIQDVLFSLYYLNTLVKTLIAAIIALVKDKLDIKFETLSLILIAIFSPLAVLLKGVLRFGIYQETVLWPDLGVIILSTTILNFLIAPLFLHLIRRFNIYGEE